ncbi:MAG: CARDB domain-containing protein, partial [Actinomycetota bacterium]
MVLGKERRQLLAMGGILTLLASVLELALVPAAGAAAKPDLVVASLSGVPASVEQGDRFGVTVKVKNAGSRKAGSSTVRFYISGNSDRDSLDIRLTGKRSVPSLKPGQSFKRKTELVVPVFAPLDTFQL